MRLGELVDSGCAAIRTGPFGTQLKASSYVAQGRPVLNVRNVGFGDVRPEKLEFIDEETAQRLAGHLLRAGDIVFGRKGAVERHAFIQEPYEGALQGSDCIRLRLDPNSPVLAHFVSYALRTPTHQDWMQRHCAHGSTMASLNQDILRLIDLPCPSMATQRQIVAVLEAFDELIENNRRRIEILEETARALYREWFVRFRFPGHESATFVDSPLGPIPDGWSIASFGDLCHSVTDALDPTEVDPETAAVGLEHLPRRSTTLCDWGHARDLASRKLSFRTGDVLFGKIRPYFHKVALAPLNGLCSTDAIVMRSANESTEGLVLAVASSDDFVAHAVRTSNGTKMPRASWPVLAEYPVVLPDERVASDFSRRSMPLVWMASFLAMQNRSLASTRDLILPKLVTGLIEVESLGVDDVFGWTELVAGVN